MKIQLSRERMILGGLLLAACAGIAFDQYARAEEAAETTDEYSVQPVAGAAKAAKAQPITPERLLADRLVELAGPAPSPEAMRDVFHAPAPVAVTPPTVQEPVAEAAAPAPAALPGRVLNGVLFGADGKGVAIIDTKMIPVGGRVDGLKLIRVTKTTAVFTDGATEVTLKLRER